MVVDPSLPLAPLQASFEENDLEADLKRLFIDLYNSNLVEKDKAIDVLGMPHLGTVDLIRQNMRQDGLAMMSDSDEDRMRYLFKAWRYLNKERGLHFLRLYLRVLYGDHYDVVQTWQNKALPYASALALKSAEEIVRDGESESDYFLTSRVRVDLDVTTVSDQIIRSLRTALAARFVLDLRVSKYFSAALPIAMVSHGVQFIRFQGEVS